ncbi:MAG: AAA family ATPase [Nitrosopumilaceae archaeon]
MIICGLPGVGKTTLAYELSPLVKAVVLSTDKIRKELIRKPTYSVRERRFVFNIFLLIAKYLHNCEVSCILDATFNRQRSRDQVKEVLGLGDEQIHIVECVCLEEIVISRLLERKDSYSDANLYVYRKMKKIFEPVVGPHIVVNTTESPRKNAEFVATLIKGKKEK